MVERFCNAPQRRGSPRRVISSPVQSSCLLKRDGRPPLREGKREPSGAGQLGIWVEMSWSPAGTLANYSATFNRPFGIAHGTITDQCTPRPKPEMNHRHRNFQSSPSMRPISLRKMPIRMPSARSSTAARSDKACTDFILSSIKGR